jgi:hypothetical protein
MSRAGACGEPAAPLRGAPQPACPAASYHASALRGQQQRPDAADAVGPALRQFWAELGPAERRKLCRINRQALFQKIRARYCSRCFGLFQLRYEELRSSGGGGCSGGGGGAAPECPACHECYAGLVVAEDGTLTLEARILDGAAAIFATFSETEIRERERELQFTTGDICGSGWHKRPGQTVCRCGAGRRGGPRWPGAGSAADPSWCGAWCARARQPPSWPARCQGGVAAGAAGAAAPHTADPPPHLPPQAAH